MTTGLISNIQNYSIHDGPGIRTTVFMKGCPLLCAWCHNPETQVFTPEIVWYKDKCMGCLTCIEACPKDALTAGKNGIKLDMEKCDRCGKCAEVCPTGAIAMIQQGEHRRPAVAEEICIGCGKCEYLCPVRPISAITVNGKEVHV